MSGVNFCGQNWRRQDVQLAPNTYNTGMLLNILFTMSRTASFLPSPTVNYLAKNINGVKDEGL